MTPHSAAPSSESLEQAVRLPLGELVLDADLALPAHTRGMVAFAHGSGSSRHSPRNRYVAAELRKRGLGTLLLDLLTREEELVDMRTAHLRFDIALLGSRMVQAVDWLARQEATANLPVGLFGSSTGAGAALVAAARRPERVVTVVSRGGRPDLTPEPELTQVRCPCLFLVGSLDQVVLELNREAMAAMAAPVELKLVPGATHLFEEPGKLEEVTRLAADWFEKHVADAR